MIFGKKKQKSKIIAPQTGVCVDLDEVPDEVFAGRLLGDGIAIIPSENEVKSPVDGSVVQVFDTLHAYSIKSDDGLEILVHIGINTVELKGEGFSASVKDGDRVRVGDTLCTIDLQLIKEKGYDIHTPILIANSENLKSLEFLKGQVVAGETAVMEYLK